MIKKNKRILFTRSLNEDQLEYGLKMNCLIDHHAFIKINLSTLDSKELAVINSGDYPNWVFTSQNAVRCLQANIDSIEIDKITRCFAVGQKTADQLSEMGIPSLIPSRYDSEALSELLNEYSNVPFLYFSGNLRQKTLIHFFEENECTYKEIKAYDTQLIQPSIHLESYDAICFCSPSAVYSFFKNYQLKNNQICFAIGISTAVALTDYSDNIIMSEQTNVFSLIQSCHEHLNL